MTNELEKTFFDTFGIKPKYEDACTVEDKYWNNEELANKYGTFDQYMNCKCGDQENCTTECSCAYQREVYPQITSDILLELMELLMKQQATEFYYHDEYLFSSKLLGSNRPTCNRVKNLRELVLRTATCLCGFAPLKDKMLKQVRTLFEDEKFTK